MTPSTTSDCNHDTPASFVALPGSAITDALQAAGTLAMASGKPKLAAEFVLRAREHVKERELLDWAEALLCNAIPEPPCSESEWRIIIKRWRDEKHGVVAEQVLTCV